MVNYFFLLMLIIICGLFLYGCKTLSVPKYKGPITENWDGKRFNNPSGNEMGSFVKLMRYQSKTKRGVFEVLPETKYKKIDFADVDRQAIYYKQINHATTLVQHKGKNILTDPVYSKRASPFTFMGPKRHREPAIPFDELPKIDIIVISHDHYDHLDIATLKRLSERDEPTIYVGLGTKAFLEKFKIKNVVDMDWGDHQMNGEIKVSFLPAKHWSNRFMSPRKTLWGSWMFSSKEKNIYYAGDTAYDNHFKAIKDEYKTIDLALIPIGAYKPRFFMEHVHMAPEIAYKAHQDLAPSTSFAIHWGTFQLTHEGMFDPVDELQEILQTENDNTFHYDRNHDQYYKID